MSDKHTKNWPDLAIGLYDRLTGMNAEICYQFDDINLKVPSGTGPDAEHADWLVNGKLTVSTRNRDDSPN